MEVVERQIQDLIPAEYNPRYITDDAFEQLKASIQRFDTLEPIIVNMHPERKNIIISGHQRIRAAKDLGMDTFPTVEVSLTRDEERELNVRMNKNTGDFDWDELANHFSGEELEDWGFSDEELFGDGVFDEPEVEEDDFEVPDEDDIETDIQEGDLIEIGRHRLLCGDSTDKEQVNYLMGGEKADMVFTSPPYNGDSGISTSRGGMENDGFYLDNDMDDMSRQEFVDLNESALSSIKEVASEDLVIFYNLNYNNNSPDAYIDIMNKAIKKFSLVETIAWEKQMAVSLIGDNLTRIFEFIFLLYNGDGKPKMTKGKNECVKNLWKVDNIGASSDNHRAAFPIKLVDQAIKYYATDSCRILDPFLGSGTTMVAAHQLDRTCYGMELDPKYCQVIVDRMLKLDRTLEVKVNGEPFKKLHNGLRHRKLKRESD